MEPPEVDPPTLRELSAVADDLVEQASEIRRQWDELADLLAPAPAGAPQDRRDAMWLVAIDMTLSGRSPAEIGAYLREAFGPDGVQAIVDRVAEEFAIGQ